MTCQSTFFLFKYHLTVLPLEFRDEVLELFLKLQISVGVYCVVELDEFILIKLVVIKLRLEDKLVICRDCCVLFCKKFFVELLARAEAGDNDLLLPWHRL